MSLTTSPKDDPMQIDKIRFKPLTKQRRIVENGKSDHVTHECLKKHRPHAARAISITNPQPKESKNEHVKSQ
jgi:hypothetical protein